MKLLTVMLSIFFTLSTLNAAAFEQEANSKTAQVHMSSEKPLVVGNNSVDFKIIGTKESLEGAAVFVKAFMPAMPGMPYMQSVADATDLGNGIYRANLDLYMGGTWQLHIFITPKEGKKIRVKSSVNL